jgi:RsiW-degrading membrane proteinase PrsW (M82 family)
MVFETPGPLLILAFAFIPPLVFLVRIRNIERFNRNPLGVTFMVFAWGAIAAIVLAVILESRLAVPLDSYRPLRVPSDMWLAVILGPVVEEPAKLIGVMLLSRRRLAEEEDGLVYGAAAGLGFAATENLMYEWGALAIALQQGATPQEAFVAWLTVSVMRMLTSTLLHASSSAMAGWGVAKAKQRGVGHGLILKFLLLAMLMHGTFNFIATLPLLFPDSFTVSLVSILLIFVFAGGVFRFTRAKIRELDRRGMPRAAA